MALTDKTVSFDRVDSHIIAPVYGGDHLLLGFYLGQRQQFSRFFSLSYLRLSSLIKSLILWVSSLLDFSVYLFAHLSVNWTVASISTVRRIRKGNDGNRYRVNFRYGTSPDRPASL